MLELRVGGEFPQLRVGVFLRNHGAERSTAGVRFGSMVTATAAEATKTTAPARPTSGSQGWSDEKLTWNRRTVNESRANGTVVPRTLTRL